MDIKILNTDIKSIKLNDLLKDLKQGVVFTPNVDHLVKLQKDKEFYDCYAKADWIICDSKIVGVAGKILGTPFAEVIPGSSLLPAFYNFHKDNEEIKIFLLGAAEGVAKKAMQNINSKVGRLMVVEAHSPSFGFEKNEIECEKIVHMIKQSGANVLVVGVGAPKQEKWIIKYKNMLSGVDLILALGATIDFEAGNIKRAPRIFQVLYLEWLFRLFKEPKRLWKRYLVDDLPFVLFILKQKFKSYKDPFKSKL
ncbi:glycosyl transferase [Flavobacterium akiainvivens]|uniref:Glycosyl transferase n=1 Tax=Flavobacterium akiainvivens TaxID=1202724 RepID=A0A0M9VI87_9FLAO|nr:WecB/TagA/CpsF family glycosyltransferase [Flavobacterium akiainvivens]KOS06362.1 glycosyl transferase [Flavobacterium akiainvivens]SFQ15166.1 polymer biosynthesis protein, WecB/TagA/CpsF family [Flavobacterium akiainvivens]